MTFFFSILLHLSDPSAPPSVLMDTFPSMEQCLLFEEMLDNDEGIKAIEKKGNIKSFTFCTNAVSNIREESDSKSDPSTVSQS